MSVHNVAQDQQEISKIRWNDDSDYDLIKHRSGVTLAAAGVHDMHEYDSCLIDDAVEAENLIKALQKAIDLGWFE
jgi:hypothetical protein